MSADGAAPLPYPVGTDPRTLALSLRQVIDYLRTRQTDTDQSTAIEELQQAVADLEASDAAQDILISELEAGAMTPQERFELALVTAIDTVQGSIQEAHAYVEQQLRHAADAVNQLQSMVNTSDAAIIVEQTVRSSEREALAQQITTLDASLGVTNANLTAEQTARVNGDNALASNITVVETNVASNTSSIATIQTSVDGISSRWGVVVNAQNQVVGMIQLDGSASGSAFTVVVDKFIVANLSGGQLTTPFVIGNVNGVSTVAINGALVVDGSILARHIAAGQIDASKINVATLSAIAANVGTLTAGRIQSTDNTSWWDLGTGEIVLGAPP